MESKVRENQVLQNQMQLAQTAVLIQVPSLSILLA